MLLCIEDSTPDSIRLHGILRIITQRGLLFVIGHREAIQALGDLRKPPVLILCDLLMEGNGNATIRFLREHYPTVPVIVVTGATEEDRVEAVASGAFAVLTKDEPGLSMQLERYLVDLGIEAPKP